MGRTSRFRWRVKPILDVSGRNVKNNFAIVRPHRNGDYALFLWAVLNSPLANAFVASRTMRKHNYEGILGDIPIPPAGTRWYGEVVEAATAYRDVATKRNADLAKQQKTIAGHAPLFDPPEPDSPVAPEIAVRDALLRLDAAVLRAYALPARSERQLLDYFNGNDRSGVGCTFGDYYPAEFKSVVPLHKFISREYRDSAIGAVASRLKPGESMHITAGLRAAARAYGEEGTDA
jgi:hypothetical protein